MNKSSFITVIISAVCIPVIMCFIGCDQSSDVKIKEQARQDTDQAQRLIQASLEKVPADPKVIKQAAKGNPKQLARQLAAKSNEIVTNEQFEQALAKLNQISQQLQSGNLKPTEITGYCNQVMLLSNTISAQEDKWDSQTWKMREDRLDRAENKLLQAINNVNNDRKARVAPELLLGGIQLTRAANSSYQCYLQDLAIQKLLLNLGRLREKYLAQETMIAQLQSRRPGNTIAQLEKELATARQDLQVVTNGLQRLLEQKKQLKKQLDSNSRKSRQLYNEYIQTLQKADKILDSQRFQEEQKAYQLRIGTKDNPGGIYYETQTDLTQIKLDVLKNRISFQKMRQNRLTKLVSMLENRLEQLKTNPDLNENVDKGIAQSKQIEQQLLDSMAQLLNRIQEAEKQYTRTRETALKYFKESESRFNDAARDAAMRETKQYARDMIERILYRQLDDLWLADASHYQANASILALFKDLPKIGDQISELTKTYESAAQTAKQNADSITPKEPPAPSAKTEPAVAPKPAPATTTSPTPKKPGSAQSAPATNPPALDLALDPNSSK